MKVILTLVAYTLIVTTSKTLAYKYFKCGTSPGACDGRLGNFIVPWQANLTLSYTTHSGKIYRHYCEAVLISLNHILSTSRCVSHYPKVIHSVRLGGKDGKKYLVKRWYIEGGNIWDFNVRLAIGILTKKVILTPHLVQPICLPSPYTTNYKRKSLTMTEWSKGTPNSKSGILKYFSKYSDECLKAKEEFHRDPLDIEMCVKMKKGRVCEKDIGAPIAYSSSIKRCYLIGIISDANRNCKALVNYAINIPKSMHWIKMILNKS